MKNTFAVKNASVYRTEMRDFAPATVVVEEGKIVKTEPEKGEPLETGMEVVLHISKGPELVKMPNVMGMNIDTAITVLKAAGFQTVFFSQLIDYVEKGTSRN